VALATSRSNAGQLLAALCAVVVKAIPALATRNLCSIARALAFGVAAAVVCLARVLFAALCAVVVKASRAIATRNLCSLARAFAFGVAAAVVGMTRVHPFCAARVALLVERVASFKPCRTTTDLGPVSVVHERVHVTDIASCISFGATTVSVTLAFARIVAAGTVVLATNR